MGSDIDIVVIRPDKIGDDDPAWHGAVENWRQYVRRLTGNAVEILDVAATDDSRLLRSRRPLWSDIRRHGIVVHGRTLDELAGRRSALALAVELFPDDLLAADLGPPRRGRGR